MIYVYGLLSAIIGGIIGTGIGLFIFKYLMKPFMNWLNK